MAQQDNTKLYTNLAILGAAYFLVAKPILEGFGLKKTAEELETERKNKELIDTMVADEKKKQAATKSDAEWKIIADQIYNDLRYSSFDDNKEDAGVQVTRVKNDTDFAVLFRLFAKRREYLFGIPAGGLMNLSQFIISNLSKEKISLINDNYRRKNIKYRF